MSKEIDVKAIRGNAPDDTKFAVADALLAFGLSRYSNELGFAETILKRINVVEVTINPQKGSPERKECVVMSELDVESDMASGLRFMQGGCTAFLIDVCTSLPLVALVGAYAGVSSSLTLHYHAPAAVGDRLRIITKSLAVGGRTMSAQGEIWNITKSRLHATGTHVKMLLQTKHEHKL